MVFLLTGGIGEGIWHWNWYLHSTTFIVWSVAHDQFFPYVCKLYTSIYSQRVCIHVTAITWAIVLVISTGKFETPKSKWLPQSRFIEPVRLYESFTYWLSFCTDGAAEMAQTNPHSIRTYKWKIVFHGMPKYLITFFQTKVTVNSIVSSL